MSKSKTQKEFPRAVVDYSSDQLDNISNNNNNEDNDDEPAKDTVLIYCITDSLFSKKPTFNECNKTLHIYADRDIIIKPREYRLVNTNEKIYLSEYAHNFGRIGNKYSGTFLNIQFNFLKEGNLNQEIKITIKNLSCFTYKISQNDELGVITFVTNKEIKFQLVTAYQLIFNPLTKLTFDNEQNKRGT